MRVLWIVLIAISFAPTSLWGQEVDKGFSPHFFGHGVTVAAIGVVNNSDVQVYEAAGPRLLFQLRPKTMLLTGLSYQVAIGSGNHGPVLPVILSRAVGQRGWNVDANVVGFADFAPNGRSAALVSAGPGVSRITPYGVAVFSISTSFLLNEPQWTRSMGVFIGYTLVKKK